MNQLGTFTVERLNKARERDWVRINDLLSQLSSTAKPISFDDLIELLEADANRVYVARNEGGVVIGMMMLVVVKQFVGTKCWIEDVVVDKLWRRRHVADDMMSMAIADAPARAKHINLTSKPMRGAAHNLYTRLGFELRETDVFRLSPQQ